MVTLISAGKSYTMSGAGPAGGAETGMIYRSLERLFADLDKIPTSCARVYISYLQIYCETLQVRGASEQMPCREY